MAIERAQRAAVIGPIKNTDVASLVSQVGDMARALVCAARQFLHEKLGMPAEEVRKAGGVQACSTDGDKLLVKFGSIAQARLLNQYKKNLVPRIQNSRFL